MGGRSSQLKSLIQIKAEFSKEWLMQRKQQGGINTQNALLMINRIFGVLETHVNIFELNDFRENRK